MLARNRLKAAVGALALGIVAAGGAGCGSGGDGGEARTHVRTAYAQLQSRFEARDAQGICARISRAAKRQIGSFGHAQPTTCVRDVRQLFKWIPRGGASGTTAPKLVSVAIDGDQATATARLSAKALGRIPFVKEEDKWRLDNFFGITAPPPPDML